jgi:hypothetical protein
MYVSANADITLMLVLARLARIGKIASLYLRAQRPNARDLGI